MIRIALVEDDPLYTKQLREYLTRFEGENHTRFSVREFRDGDEIALDYRAEYDIILMDIQMNYMDGMTAAQEIRKRDREVAIIFITNMSAYAIRGYSVDALDYILKPFSYFTFSTSLEKAISRLQRRTKRYLYLANRSGSQKVEAGRIYFVEVDGHSLAYHTADGLLTATGTMKEVEESLAGMSFFRCNKCYLVNLEYVDGIRGDDALVHGTPVQISRAKKKAFLDALNGYMNEVG